MSKKYLGIVKNFHAREDLKPGRPLIEKRRGLMMTKGQNLNHTNEHLWVSQVFIFFCRFFQLLLLL